jgi:hypothetical protein
MVKKWKKDKIRILNVPPPCAGNLVALNVEKNPKNKFFFW